MRAYSWFPFDENTSGVILTSDVMPNTSLINSVHVNIVGTITNTFGGIKDDSLFSTGPAVNCFWMMNLGSSMHVKAVLLMGDYNNKANTANWSLTVGDNSNPILNAVIISSSVWARDIKVGAWGQFVAIIRSTATSFLRLAYVGVFATAYDCNLTNTFTVASLPATIPVGSTYTYTVINSLNAICIDSVYLVQ